MLKVAVIGVGSMGQNHARVYRGMDGVRLVGVADTDGKAVARVGEWHSVPSFEDFHALLDEEGFAHLLRTGELPE